jgi:hypothetical protein
VTLLVAVPGLRSVGRRIADAQPGRLVLAIVAELLSCLGSIVAVEPISLASRL